MLTDRLLVSCLVIFALLCATDRAIGECGEPLEAGLTDGKSDNVRSTVVSFLKTYCLDCHGADQSAADFRLDDIDVNITAGQDVERWEKTLEMLSILDMPPEDAEAQPGKQERRQLTEWIHTELRKIGRGPDDARLVRPEFGNRLDHEELFSGEHDGPSWSPSRLWRKSAAIHRLFEQTLRSESGNSPFAPKGGHGFQDYSILLANESTIKSLRINSKNYIAELIDGKLVAAKGADGKPDRQKRVRTGRSPYAEFNALVHDSKRSPADLANAITRAFQILLRREPTDQEIDRYADQYLTRAIEIAGPREGLESVLTAIILSPEFVYRQEIGLGQVLPDGRRMLAPRELAYAIAYALTDSPPDRDLQKAFEEGRLTTRDDVEREVRRMLESNTRPYWDYEINHTFEKWVDACPNPRLLRFFREFFGYDRVFDVFKDESRNPHHKPQFLFKDADLFVLSILEKDQQVLRELLTSDQYLVHYVSPEKAERNLQRLLKGKNAESVREQIAGGRTPVLGGYRGGSYYTVYGFERETWNYPVEQPFKVEHRAGMLTHPAWLAAHSGNFDTDPIRRGKWIREHLLADTVPDIPIGVDAALEDDPHKTMRERLAKTNEAVCWRCHKKMNPLGLPFEAFDDFGRYRERFFFDGDGKFGGTYYERERRLKISQQRKQPKVEFTSRPINTSGWLRGTGDPQLDGTVKDAFDLIERIADSERARQSFIRHAFRYWMGRNEMLDDSPTLMDAEQAYLESDGSFKELLVSLLTSDSFLTRKDM